MGEPPRGTYYPASPGSGNQPPRHYQFNATNPWEREEREKVLKSQIICAPLLTLNALWCWNEIDPLFLWSFSMAWFGVFLSVIVWYISFHTILRFLFAGKGRLTVCG